MSEKISCPRCEKKEVGRPLEDIYTDLGDGYFSYLKYKCTDCGCEFLIRDDYISPGEWAMRNIMMARLAVGKMPTTVAEELHMSPERVDSMIERPVDLRGPDFSCPTGSRNRHLSRSSRIAYKPHRKRITKQEEYIMT